MSKPTVVDLINLDRESHQIFYLRRVVNELFTRKRRALATTSSDCAASVNRNVIMVADAANDLVAQPKKASIDLHERRNVITNSMVCAIITRLCRSSIFFCNLKLRRVRVIFSSVMMEKAVKEWDDSFLLLRKSIASRKYLFEFHLCGRLI